MGKNRITIKDIARELHISTSTVSRALADKWDVNPDTRKAVLELAEKWNYKPNPISISLKQQQSMSIGVIIPEFIKSFFPEIIMGIESVLRPNGYHVLICQSNESAEIELVNLKALEAKMVDGFIISVTGTKNYTYFQNLINSHFPVVFFNRICSGLDASQVVIDDYKWAYQAVKYLIDNGYKRIAHLAGPDDLELALKRKNGYIDALTRHNLKVDENLIIPCGIQMERGVMGAHSILNMTHRPDAVFAINDPVAIGAMKTLQRNGVKIPDDMAIVGFTESKMAMIIEPNLTSIEQPTFEMGTTAAELLLEQIRNNSDEPVSPKKIVLEARLNIRGSSTPEKQ
jgi:LacI family transcriptional regulator